MCYLLKQKYFLYSIIIYLFEYVAIQENAITFTTDIQI